MIGPMDANPTKPKLSAEAVFEPLIEDIPTPRARIKGTVIGPVVAPPASNATAKKIGGEKKARINTIMYPPNNSKRREIL